MCVRARARARARACVCVCVCVCLHVYCIFCICTGSAQLSMIHMERPSINTLIIITIIMETSIRTLEIIQ